MGDAVALGLEAVELPKYGPCKEDVIALRLSVEKVRRNLILSHSRGCPARKEDITTLTTVVGDFRAKLAHGAQSNSEVMLANALDKIWRIIREAAGSTW